jgi:hypothetical protein
MGAHVEVQPQIKLPLTETGLLIEDAEKSFRELDISPKGA